MSHSLLPSREGRSNQEPDARYGDEAMSLMLRALQKRGISPKQCQAKIFGGGSMFSCQAQHDDIGIGKRNGMAAEHIVKSHGIQLISTSLYGSGYRRIIFDLSTGHVWSRLTSISERFPTG